MIDLEEFIDHITEAVEEELECCGPDEDVAPALFVLHGDSCEMMMIGSFFGDEASKAAFSARILPVTLHKFEADHFAMVQHHLVFSCDNPAIADQFRAWVRDHPEESWANNPVWPPDEVLGIIFGSRDGTVVAKSARLARSQDASPEKEEWEEERFVWTDRESRPMMRGRFIDFAMEAITGKKLVTESGFRKASKAISENGEIRAMICSVWEAMGLTPEEGLEKAAREGEAAYREVDEKLRELFPDFHDKVAALAEEHLPSAADEYIADAGVPEGMVVMLSSDGEIEPLASFMREESFRELLEDPTEDE